MKIVFHMIERTFLKPHNTNAHLHLVRTRRPWYQFLNHCDALCLGRVIESLSAIQYLSKTWWFLLGCYWNRTYIIKFWNANNYRNVWSFLDSTYTCVNKLFIADIRLTIMPLVTEINGGITAHDQSFDRLKQAVLWKDSIKVDKMFPLS